MKPSRNNTRQKVSIAIATFNGSKYIEEQLQSLIGQNYPFIEIIIADDKSTDNTYDVLRDWEKTYPEKISVSRNEENLGFNKNFEKIIANCTGEYIAIADQDDIWLPNKISKLVEALQPPENILAHCRSIAFNENKGVFKRGSLERQHSFSGNDLRQLVFFNQIEGHNMIFKRELLNSIFPFPENVYYDWWIAAIAAIYGNIASVEEYLVKHRLHDRNYYYTNRRDNKTELKEKLTFVKALAEIDTKNKSSNRFVSEALQVLASKIHRNVGSFDYKFFNFLFAHRRLIFGFKKRKSILKKEWVLLKSALKLASL